MTDLQHHSIDRMKEQARPMPPGYVEYRCRRAIRDMIEEHGAKLAARLVMQTLDDETARAKR